MISTGIKDALELVLAFGRELWVGTDAHNRLTPSLSVSQILQTLRNAVQTFVDVLKDGGDNLLSLEHVEQSLPGLADLVRLVADVGAPVDTGNGDVLEENQVGGDLLNCAGSETDDDDAAVPSNDLEGWDNHTDGVVDYVNAVTLGDLCEVGWDQHRERIQLVHKMIRTFNEEEGVGRV